MIIKLAWRNLWRNKLRTRIVLGAVVFGVLGVTLMIGFMNGMVNNMISNAINWQTSHLQIEYKSYRADPDINKTLVEEPQLKVFLDSLPEIKAWTSRQLAQGMIASAHSARGITILGIDLESEVQVTPIADNIIAGKWLTDQGRNPILVSKKTAQRLKLRVGSKVVLTLTNMSGDVAGGAFRVRGLFKSPSSAFDDSHLFVRKHDLNKLSGLKADHQIAILLKDDNSLAPLKTKIKQQLAAENSVEDWTEIQPMLATMTASMGSSNLIILVIFVVAMSFGIVNIVLMSVFERTREFGVLMAVGMQKQKILTLILFESSFLGLVGGCLGIGVSWLLLAVLKITGLPLSSMAEGLSAMGIDSLLYPDVAVGDYLLIFSTVVLASFLAGFYPARQILKQRPVDAMSAA